MTNWQYASIAKRFISFTIDDIVVSLLFIAIFYNQITGLNTPESLVYFIRDNVLYLLILKVAYHTFLIALNGQTLGKYFMKIKAVDEDNFQTISWNRAFLRAAFRTLGEMFFYFTFIFAFFDKKNQTLHDKIAKCVVVNV
jgi:uncharacterized RDD family membrane protein YckC